MSKGDSKPVQPPDPTLAGWWEFVRRNRNVMVGMLTYCAIPPVLQFVFYVGPPWPPNASTVTAFTSIVGYAVAILVFAAHEHGTSTFAKLKVLRQKLKKTVGIGAILGAVYIVLCAFFLYEAGSPKHHVAGGFLLRPEIQEEIKTQPSYTPATALFEGKNNPEMIWIPWSVKAMNAAFLFSWLGFFGAIAAFLGLFVVYLRMLGAKEPQPIATS